MAHNKIPDHHADRPDVQPQHLSGSGAGTGGASAGDQATRPEPSQPSGGKAAGDVATPLQPGGTRLGGGPGAGLGSIGTGGGNTAGGRTGSQKRSGR
ncbi:MAG: hypothetical protein ACJ8AI_01600 [Rhodopila sp.]